MPANKSNYFYGFSLLEVIIILSLVSVLSNAAIQQKADQFSNNMGAEPSASTLLGLSQIHNEIDALPIAPEIRQQMLLYIEIAEQEIETGNAGNAREAVLDFCRRIEWYRYQIGHTKIDRMFNQAMAIAVELHNAATG